jgi:hypothetical protein
MHKTSFVLMASVLFACGSDGADTTADPSADPEAGPAETAGAENAGGTKATGGSTSSGGATKPATGGSTASGGSTGSGGATKPATGGSTGTGGAIDNDGGPHVIGNCQGLGAIDAWENVTPPQVNAAAGMGVLSIVADPIHAGTIYSGTDRQGLHKSTDCGATWTKINTGAYASVIGSGGLWALRIDPVEPNIMFAGSLYGSDPSLLKSTNGGVDWASVFPAGSEVANTVDYNFFQDVGMDVTNHRHLVVTFHASCNGAYAPTCMAESNDSGVTWRLFKGAGTEWGERAGVIVFGPKAYLYHTFMGGSYYTSDGGSSWEKFGPGTNFAMYRAKDGYFYLGSYNWGTNRSLDGHTWTAVANSPSCDPLIGDGNRIFCATGVDTNPDYYATPESDTTKWAKITGPAGTKRAANIDYDGDHHVLYSAKTNDGLYRMVTK